MSAAPAAATPPEITSWAARYWLWDTYFAAVTVGVGASLAVDAALSPVRRAAVLAALAGLAGWYLAFGRRLMRDEREDWRGYAYLAGAFALYLPAVSLAGSASFVLFALCAQAYMLTTPVPATIVVVGFNSVHIVRLLVRTGDLGQVLTGPLPAAVLVVVLSATIGTWARRTVQQSEERAGLIRELDSSRAEVARLSHEAGVVAERQRLAGEIHDTIAQGLTSVVMLIQAADADLDGDPARARRHLDLAARTARENLAEARDLIAALTPSALTGSSLADALRRLVARFVAEVGVAADFRTEGTPVPLPTPAEVVLLRAAQESLTNVRKHAAARAVSVRLSYRRDAVALEVTDDGRGMPGTSTAVVGPDGYGLTTMRARVEQVSGVLTVGPRAGGTPAGRGTTVRVEVPA